MPVVTVNNNEVGNFLLNFRQGRELSKHLLLVDFPNACAFKWEGEDLLILLGTHFQLSCWRERSCNNRISHLKALKQIG